MEKLTINKLPTKTWNRLKVNEAVIDWDEMNTVSLAPENIKAENGETADTVCLTVRGEGEYSSKKINISGAEGSGLTVFEDLRSSARLAADTEVSLSAGAKLRLVQLISADKGALIRSAVTAKLAENASLELVQALIGGGDIYSDSRAELEGDGAALRADIGYLGKDEQKIDVNLVANHYGKRTKSEIEADGALRDSAEKVFRGTIDFKTGSADSVGDEKETVLMLGENVVNKTVPLILCAEENVQGNHGATIGELDEATLFYFASRGIDKKQAEDMLARAAIERVSRLAHEKDIEETIVAKLNEEL